MPRARVIEEVGLLLDLLDRFEDLFVLELVLGEGRFGLVLQKLEQLRVLI